MTGTVQWWQRVLVLLSAAPAGVWLVVVLTQRGPSYEVLEILTGCFTAALVMPVLAWSQKAYLAACVLAGVLVAMASALTFWLWFYVPIAYGTILAGLVRRRNEAALVVGMAAINGAIAYALLAR